MAMRTTILPVRGACCATMLLLLLIGAAPVALAGDAAPPKDDLSPAARRALNGAEEAIAKARAAFKAAAAKEQEKLLTALQREQEAQTKAGRLEAALAVKAAADRVRSGEYLAELEAQAAASTDLLGDGAAAGAAGPSLARFAGPWRMTFSNDWWRVVRVEPDGRVQVMESNNVPAGSAYTIRWDQRSQRFVTETLGGNMLETYRVEGDRLLCDHWCDRGRYPAEGPSLTAQLDRPAPPQGQDRPQRRTQQR